jgi:hypothetical protein
VAARSAAFLPTLSAALDRVLGAQAAQRRAAGG